MTPPDDPAPHARLPVADRHDAEPPTRRQEFLTVAEAAYFLKVSPKTVRKYIDAGLLPAKRLPWGHFRIARSAIEALLA